MLWSVRQNTARLFTYSPAFERAPINVQAKSAKKSDWGMSKPTLFGGACGLGVGAF